jgi:hypothetical protein
MHFSTLQYPSHAFLFDHSFGIAWYRAQIKKLNYTVSSIVLTLSFYLLPNISHITLFSGSLNLYNSLNVADQVPQKLKSTSLIIFDRIIGKLSVHAMKSYGGLEV